jgi:hypothetical protein
LLEANIGGVAIKPLNERLRRTSAGKIAVRKLVGTKSHNFKGMLRKVAQEAVGKKYNSSFPQMLQGILTSYTEHANKTGKYILFSF